MAEERNNFKSVNLEPISLSLRDRLLRSPTPQTYITAPMGLMSLTTESPQLSSASSSASSAMRRRRFSPYVRRRTPRRRRFVWTSSCHSKFVEAVKQSGGFDKVTAAAVWEIVKEEMMDGVSPATLKDASNVLDMLQFMFPDYMVNPPSALTFFLGAESERNLCDAMVSDFGKLKLEPKTEPGSCDNIVNDFGKLILELTKYG